MAELFAVRDTTTGKLILKPLEGTGTIVASEALTANDLVNIFDDAGTLKIRQADAATGKPAHGFVTANVAQDADATVYYKGVIPMVANEGSYFTGDAGAVTQAPTYDVGDMVQYAGYGSPDGVYFEPDEDATVSA